jgi:glycosyltransferase involved in cell wall biosynthesis
MKQTNKKIYILHEFYSKSHYRGLIHLCSNNKVNIIFREFSISKNIIRSLIKLDISLLNKQLLNITFLLILFFTKNKKIVLGIAPYDFRLIFLKYILRNHKVYYHTSWACWDKTYYPKRFLVNNFIINLWKDFLKKDIVKIFSVTQYTKNELMKNIGLTDEKVKVVYHSFDDQIFKKYDLPKNYERLKFLYVGRLVKEKGILEILDYFSKKKNINLSLVGDGLLKDTVKKYSGKYKNIKYLGYISDQKRLAQICNQNNFLLLNSKKVDKWEELFGMVVIEAMACGVVPITTNHKGPQEIIESGINGYLFDESNFIENVNEIIDRFNVKEYEKMQTEGLKKANEFTLSRIAQRWQDILNG